jgi:DNA replication protein DnaC
MEPIKNIISKSQNASDNESIPQTWRRQSFPISEWNDLKFDLIDMVKENFFQANGKVILNDEDKSNLKVIFNWLIGNEIDLSLNKGLMFTGNWGTGKSIFIKGIILFINKYYSIDILQNGISNPVYMLAQDMANLFKEDNVNEINKMKSTSIMAIDDLGYEPVEVNHFGTKCHPFEEVLMSRYDRKKTILLTTNLSLDQIGERYGWHIYDRLKQMTYILEFTGKSKRV